MKHRFLAVFLCIALLFTAVACNPSTVSTIEQYVNEFLPILETVANLILATEAPGVVAVAQPIETQINNDLQLIETNAATITSQNYSQVRQTILNLAADVQQQQGAILAACHVSNPATVAKVQALVALGNAVLQQIVNALPASNASASEMVSAKVKVGNVMTNYKHEYNKIVASKTGDAKVDAALSKSKKFRRLGVWAY